MKPSRFVDGSPMLFAGLRRHHAFTDAGEGIPAQWQAFQQLGPIPHQQGSITYGVICSGDVEKQVMEYMCAVEVAEFPPDAHLGRMRVPAQHYAVFEHPGHVSTLRDTWDAIYYDWLPLSGFRGADGPDFEVYGSRFDPATGLGGIEIWFPIVST